MDVVLVEEWRCSSFINFPFLFTKKENMLQCTTMHMFFCFFYDLRFKICLNFDSLLIGSFIVC